MDTDKFIKLIRKRIETMGLKKSYVANRIGLCKVRFSQSLNKKRRFTSEEITKLKKLLNI